jgi:hypothetical protein
MYDKPIEKHQQMHEPRYPRLRLGEHRTDMAAHRPAGKPGCRPHLGVAKFPKIMALPEVFF